MSNAKIDDNFKPSLIAVSTANGETPVRLEADPTTGALLTTMTTGTLVPEEFDTITAAYNDETFTEVYTYKLLGSTVATVTVIYTDISKDKLVSIVRS